MRILAQDLEQGNQIIGKGTIIGLLHAGRAVRVTYVDDETEDFPYGTAVEVR